MIPNIPNLLVTLRQHAGKPGKLDSFLSTAALLSISDRVESYCRTRLQEWRLQWKASPDAPEDFAGLLAEYKATHVIHVSTENSDSTAFRTPFGNYVFRAWHDACHIRSRIGFSVDDERRLWAIVKPTLQRLPVDVYTFIEAEQFGQLQFYAKTGGFPVNQRAFTLQYLQNGSF
jgi:hypothetical protein